MKNYPENEVKTNDILLKFSDLSIDEKIKEALLKMNIMTPIQAKCIPHLLKGNDLMGAAKTGSGKTLAFLVPLVEKLIKSDMSPNHGTAAIILSPTRELSKQIYEVLNQLIAKTNIISELITGGKNAKTEARLLKNGVTVVVATPGRLKYHLNETEHFLTHRLHTLIIDEADRLMDQGFYVDMQSILDKLPKERQTVLFSATLNVNSDKIRTKMKNVKENGLSKKATTEDRVLSLASLSLKKNYVFIDISIEDLPGTIGSTRTVSQLSQSYIVLEPQYRFLVLYAMIQRWKNKKVMIFMATNYEVKYYCLLLHYINVSVLPFYGKLSQAERDLNYGKFRDNENGVIVCTDVAARGLDIPDVDWVIQFDPPRDHKEYIHRVGRTARAGHSGQAILFLRPHEVGFLSVMASHKIPTTELEADKEKIPPIQDKLEEFVNSHPLLKGNAEVAFLSLTKAYSTYSQKCFDINELDLFALAKTFCLKGPPQVMLNLSMKSKKRPQGSDNSYLMPMKRQKDK